MSSRGFYGLHNRQKIYIFVQNVITAVLCNIAPLKKLPMKTNRFLLLGGVAAATGSMASACADKEAEKPLNIVYIMTDDHTAQMMSCYDTRYASTPNLDRIARDGVRFTNSFVANSLSGPSRACMVTGMHSCGNRFYDNETCIFDNSQRTMPKMLQAAGYQTDRKSVV